MQRLFDWANESERRRVLVDRGAVGAETMSVELVRLAAGEKLEVAPHPGRSEFLFVLSGSGTLSSEGQSQQLTDETFAWLADDRGHVVTGSGSSDLRLLVTSAPPEGARDEGPGGPTKVLRVAEQPVVDEPSSGKKRIYLASHDLVGNHRAHAMIVIYRQGVVTPSHCHPDAESLFVFLHGRGRAIVDATEELKPVQAGQAVYYGKGDYHGLDNEYPEQFSFLEFHIPGQYGIVRRDG
jgi:mannose-6-phosphate isomerase-like protein (cupin superfamily)